MSSISSDVAIGLQPGDTIFCFDEEQQIVLTKYLAKLNLLEEETQLLYEIIERKNTSLSLQDSIIRNEMQTRKKLEQVIENNEEALEQNDLIVEGLQKDVKRQRTQKRITILAGVLAVLAALLFE